MKRGLADMLVGGVIMDVVTSDQAKIAEDAGAVAVMALERVPADIRSQGGVARNERPRSGSDGIIDAVSIPVMAKARIGHFVEAQVLKELGVDYVDESEVLDPPTTSTTSTSGRSLCRSCAERPTSARPCVASRRVRR